MASKKEVLIAGGIMIFLIMLLVIFVAKEEMDELKTIAELYEGKKILAQEQCDSLNGTLLIVETPLERPIGMYCKLNNGLEMVVGYK